MSSQELPNAEEGPIPFDRWAGPLLTHDDFTAFFAEYRLPALAWLRGKALYLESDCLHDIAQDSWAAVLNHLGSIDHARAYLYKTLNNKLNDRITAQGRQEVLTQNLQILHPPRVPDDPADLVVLPDVLKKLQEDDLEVLHAIYMLPPAQQDAYRLRVTTGASSAEIGKILGCTADNVNTRVSKARSALARVLPAGQIKRFEIVRGGGSA